MTHDLDFWPWKKNAYNLKTSGHISNNLTVISFHESNKSVHVWPRPNSDSYFIYHVLVLLPKFTLHGLWFPRTHGLILSAMTWKLLHVYVLVLCETQMLHLCTFTNDILLWFSMNIQQLFTLWPVEFPHVQLCCEYRWSSRLYVWSWNNQQIYRKRWHRCISAWDRPWQCHYQITLTPHSLP